MHGLSPTVYRPDMVIVPNKAQRHIHAITYNKDTSSFAQHILNKGHFYGNIQNTVEIIQVTQNGTHINSLEKFHIYCAHQPNEQMNEIVFISKILYSTSYTQWFLPFVDQFTALHFTVTDAPPAARHIQILPMNQYA
jgi:hypothetical protein